MCLFGAFVRAPHSTYTCTCTLKMWRKLIGYSAVVAHNPEILFLHTILFVWHMNDRHKF